MSQANFERGLWLDQGSKIGTSDDFLDMIGDVGFNHVIPVGFDLSGRIAWTPKKIEILCEKLLEKEILVSLCVWPNSKQEKIELLKDYLSDCILTGIYSIEFEIESNARQQDIEKLEPVLEYAKELQAQTGIEITCTTLPFHRQCQPESYMIENISKNINVQAYSISRRRGKNISSSDLLGPGSLQSLCIEKAEKIGAERVTIGLPLFGQHFPDIDEKEAIEVAYQACQDTNGVRYWSAKYLDEDKAAILDGLFNSEP